MMRKQNILILTFVSITFFTLALAQTPVDALNNTPGAYWNRKECNTPRRFYETLNFIQPGDGFTRSEALRWANTIRRQFPNWQQYLPCCPETMNEALDVDWVLSNEFIECYHPTAANCIRSRHVYPSPRFDENPLATGHGQQCCYDKMGKLIKNGSGAGTPDFVAPPQGFTDNKIFNDHIVIDVYTWSRLSLNENHATWIPNQGCNMPFRVIVPGIIDWYYTSLPVKRGDIIRFSDAKGEVIWGAQGSRSGPEGSRQVGESTLGLLMAPPKLLTAKTGSLIGMIYIGNLPSDREFTLDDSYMTKPFSVGVGAEIKVEADGYLFLGVNDGFPQNNSGYFDIQIQRIGRLQNR